MSVAGQVTFQRGNFIQHKLIDVARPILSIPNLAIHLDRGEEFKFNKETHLLPILATVAIKTNNNKKESELKEDEKINSINDDHHDEFLSLIAQQAGCTLNELLDLDLYLYDSQKAVNFFFK